jgi:AcrR family transcriptional regulator
MTWPSRWPICWAATQMADVVYLRSYDDRARIDDEIGRRVLDSTAGLLREVPYSRITMRSIAKRAGVSHGEICAYFRSKDAIVAEIYLDRLRAAPLVVDVEQSARARIAAQFSQLVMLLADEPGIAAACSSALICDEPSVRAIRQRIHAELQRRVRTVLRSGAWPEVAETLEFGLLGALVQASCGSGTFAENADDLASVVAVVLSDG